MVDSAALSPRRAVSAMPLLARTVNAFVDVVEPAILRLSQDKRWVAVEIDDNDFLFYRISGGQTKLLGEGNTLGERDRRLLVSKRQKDVELRLLADRVVLATLKVPADGLAYTQQIVESRLDRLTPWKPEKMMFGFAAQATPGTDGQFTVDFAATSRDIGAASIARLAHFGLVPSRMGCATEPVAERLRIDLLGGENDTTGRRRRKRIATVAVATPVLFLLIYLASAYFTFLSSERVAELEGKLTTARRLLVAGSGSMDERQKDTALLSAKTPDKARFVLIDTLAAIIPENTVLTELEIQNDTVRIAGTSTEASSLIGILEAEPSLAEARFAAPVTRQDDGRDRFDITARHAGQTRDAGQP